MARPAKPTSLPEPPALRKRAARTPAPAATGTRIFRVALAGQRSVFRDIEAEDTESLYGVALAITEAFDFDSITHSASTAAPRIEA